VTHAITVIEIIHASGLNPAAIGNELVLDGNSEREGVRAISDYLQSIAGGINGANVRVRVDSSTDADVPATGTCTLGSADIVADDTVLIGSVTLTWKADGSGSEDQVTLSTTEATAATNLAAAINAHTKLVGVVTASVASAVVTVTSDQDPRSAIHINTSRTETNSGSVTWGGANLTTASTLAQVADGVTYTMGG